MQEDYFKGNQLAQSVWSGKYALRVKGVQTEKTPREMHKRMAKEFAKVEQKYPNPVSEERIFNSFDQFSETIPQGSVMAMLGNYEQVGSLSNCIVVPKIFDSYGGIMYTDQQLAQLMKRRCVHEDSFVSTTEGPRQIKDVQVGDKVLSLHNGKEEFNTVLNTHGEKSNKKKYLITVQTGASLNVTEDHPILVSQPSGGDRTYIPAEDLSEGMLLVESEGLEVSITKIEVIDNDALYYDLTVDKAANFFTGTYGLINVHNCGVGADLSTLRPRGAEVTNAAGSSTGVPSFMERFSATTREVSQSGRN